MASIGEMRYYIFIKTYTQSKNANGVSQRSLNKTLAYYAKVTEKIPSERLNSGIAEGEKGIDIEMLKVTETIKVGDEVIYNSVAYRIDSISLDNYKNRTYVSGKANDRS